MTLFFQPFPPFAPNWGVRGVGFGGEWGLVESGFERGLGVVVVWEVRYDLHRAQPSPLTKKTRFSSPTASDHPSETLAGGVFTSI